MTNSVFCFIQIFPRLKMENFTLSQLFTMRKLWLSVVSAVGIYIFYGVYLFFQIPDIYLFDREQRIEQPYDLAVVFVGNIERIPPAIELVQQNKAKRLVVSPATEKQMQIWINKYAQGNKIPYILEPNARHTHENAAYCRDIILQENARRVLLITSFYHMPRSYRLLALALRGKDIRIDCYQVAAGKWNSNNWRENPAFSRFYFRERIKTFLSFAKFLADGLKIK